MAYTTKIATCCYCGSRSALNLTARDGHELACRRCGAPLHEMKALKQSRPHDVKRTPSRSPAHFGGFDRGKKKKHPKKRRKSSWKDRFEDVFDVFDVIEDIFD